MTNTRVLQHLMIFNFMQNQMPPSLSAIEVKKNYQSKTWSSSTTVRHNVANPIIFSEMVSGRQEAAGHFHSEGQLPLLPNVLVQPVCEPSL